MRAISMLEATPAMLTSVGFQELVFEDFLDIFKDLITSIVQPEPGHPRLTQRALFDAFNNAEGNYDLELENEGKHNSRRICRK